MPANSSRSSTRCSATSKPGWSAPIMGSAPSHLRPAHSWCHAGRRRPCPPPSRNSPATCFSRIGIYFDMGGHRFFTKVGEVKKIWNEILQNNFLLRPRLSRIYYKGKFFYYPLRPLNALKGLRVWEGLFIVLSY